MYSSAYVWAKILSYIEERLGAVTVSAWFDDAEVVELNDNNLILYSPSDFRRDIISRRCTDYIQDALKEIFNSDAKLLVFDDKAKENYLNKGKASALLPVNAGPGEELLDGYPDVFLQVQCGGGNAEAANAQRIAKKVSAMENGLRRQGRRIWLLRSGLSAVVADAALDCACHTVQTKIRIHSLHLRSPGSALCSCPGVAGPLPAPPAPVPGRHQIRFG